MKVRLGDLLVEQGLISDAQLRSALDHQRRHPGFRKLGETILALQLVTEEQMLHALSKALRITAVDLRKVSRIAPEVLETLSVETAEQELVLPLRFVRQGGARRLQVAMADPTNLQAVDELQFRLGCTVEPCLSTITQIRKAIRRFYRGSTESMNGVIDIDPTAPNKDQAELNSVREMKTWIGQDPDSGLDFSTRIVELKFFTGPRKDKAVQVPDGTEMVFGRGQDVDLTVEDNRMSRRHFQISVRGRAVELVDLGSSNGTFVNKKRVNRSMLTDGDWIQAGSTLIRVVLVEPV